MKRGRWLELGLLGALLLLAPYRPQAAARLGPHGGELHRAVGVIANASLELVVKSDAQTKAIHVYGVDAQNQPVNLANSGYGGILFRLGALELPLDFRKVDERGYISNAADRFEHYQATGKFPSDSNLELEVTVAFPSKQGTGKATFHPFRDTATKD